MTSDDLGAPAGADDTCSSCDSAGVPDGLTASDYDAWSAALAGLADAQAAVDEAFGAVHADVNTELLNATSQASTAVAEFNGQTDSALDGVQGTIAGYLNRWTGEIDRAYNASADDLFRSGVTMPYSAGSMQAQLAGDPIAMLASAVPAVGSLTGPAATADEPQMGVRDDLSPCVISPDDPYCYPGPPPVGPPPPPPPPGTVVYPPPPPPVVIITPPPPPPVGGVVYPPPTTGGVVYPPPPPYPPPPTGGVIPSPVVVTPVPPVGPVPPVVVRTGGTGSGNCCPVDVTVNVPPPSVVVLPGPGVPTPLPPAQQPPGTEPTEGDTEPPLPPGPPAEPPPQPVPGTQVPALDWNNPKACADVAGKVAGANTLGDKPGPDTRTSQFKNAVNWALDKVGDAVDEITSIPALKGVGTATAKIAEKQAEAIADFTIGGGFIQSAFSFIGEAGIPNPGAAVTWGSILSLATLSERASGFPATYLTQSLMYGVQWANPQFLPSQAQIDGAFLGAQISSDEWVCWTRANGNLPEPARRVMLSGQARTSVQDQVALYYRGKISYQQLVDSARINGVLGSNYVDDWVELYKQLPTQSDLLRFMVRDSADDRIAALYGYDTDFGVKYTGKVKEWAKSQGLTDDQFKYFWRAHWEIPSNTALFRMFQRLRPDRPERTAWEEDNPRLPGEAPEQYRTRGPAVVTRDDIAQAMRVNDQAPAWIDRLLSVSYDPITRTDATRAYLIGAFNDADLRNALLDAGYSPANADTLLGFYRTQKSQRQNNIGGGWSPRKIARFYRDGTVDKESAYKLLGQSIPSDKDRRTLIDGWDQELRANSLKLSIAGARRGFLAGELDRAGAERVLFDAGADPRQMERLLSDWTVLRDTRYKQPSAAAVLDWMGARLIMPGEAHRRLTNLGYSGEDADRMIELKLMKGEAKGGMSAEEAGGVWESAVRTARGARKESNSRLGTRLNQLITEALRIRGEINRRRALAGDGQLPPVQLP